MIGKENIVRTRQKDRKRIPAASRYEINEL